MTRQQLVIRAGKAERNYWRDIWRYRELLYILSWRDLVVRYKQTAVGVAWALVQPLVTTTVFTILFGRLAHFPSAGVPYPILVFSAMLPWQFFASALNDTTNSLIGNSNLLAKVYFPRILIPASTILVCLVDFLIASVIMIGLFIYYGQTPDWHIVMLPVFVLMTIATVFAFGLWLAIFNVKYRDFRYVVPFIIQVGLFLSPIGFSSTVIPDKWRTLYELNPMVEVIEGFRWSLLRGNGAITPQNIGIACAILAAVLFSGIWYFRKTERTFADVL
jgi:lipopolysaccharide transport system permease protein